MNKIKSHFLDKKNVSEYIFDSDVDWANNSVFVKYTTGSTGPSKGVIYNHAMLHSHIKILNLKVLIVTTYFLGVLVL
jgi:acyl-CoA synthetase (AMP-forming)/AMP-acid ligase II